MARRHWTLMVVPDDHTGVRQFRLSNRALRVTLTSAMVAFVVLSTLAAGFLVKENERLEASRLAKANEMLVAEIEGLREGIQTLETSLEYLSEKDEHYRLLANLEPLDDDVKLAGVGGPGSRTVEASHLWNIDRPLARLSFGVSEDLNALIRRANLLASSWDEATQSMSTQVDIWERTPSILPTAGYRTSAFSRNRMHPILNVRRPHKGVDIAARAGTAVVAAAKGSVRYAGNTGGDYGYMVEIDHGRGVITRYAHLARGSVVVRTGQTVDRWEKVGEVGATGLVTSPSLHYEVIVNGVAQDPEKFVIPGELPF